MKKINWILPLAIPLLTVASLGSCSKSSNNEVGDGTTAQVEFAVSGSEFDGVVNISNRAATPYLQETIETQSVKNTLDVGDGMLLIAELTPEDPQKVKDQRLSTASSSDAKKAAIETGNLASGTRYRVVVFDSNGAYVRQQEYSSGNESIAPAMMLDGGRTYTFIAYSINTSAPVPEPTFTGGQQNLASTVVSVAGNQDFMYFRRELTLVGGPTPNLLNIVLKHRFSQVTTIVNATQTGYNPASITASFGPHSNTALIDLNTGVITRNTQTDRSSVTTLFFENATTDSYTTIVNAAANAVTTYNIASLTVGPLTLTDLTPFPNLTMTPGVKYNLTINLVPTDEFLVHEGRPAARINGVIWARHNIDVDINQDDQKPEYDVELHGTYRQWGRIIVSANRNSNSTTSFLNNNGPGGSAWNAGTTAVPVKATADPCPDGYRVPTYPEIQDLVGETIQTNQGNFASGTTNFTAAKVFTSKRNSSVRLLFPAQGWFSVSGGNAPPYNSLNNSTRGSRGEYWSSTVTAATYRIGYLYFTSSTAAADIRPSNRASPVSSRNVRCVGIQI